MKYRFQHWMFRWVQDLDGDIGLQFFGIITFVKYKEHTIVYWRKKFESATKWQGSRYDGD